MALGGSNFKLRSSTNNDPYASLKFTAGSDYTSGQLLKVGDTVGVVVQDVASGAEGVLCYRAAKIVVACVAATTGMFAIGTKVYYDVADAEVNQSSSGNYLCGIVTTAAAVGDETVEIDLNGCLGIS